MLRHPSFSNCTYTRTHNIPPPPPTHPFAAGAQVRRFESPIYIVFILHLSQRPGADVSYLLACHARMHRRTCVDKYMNMCNDESNRCPIMLPDYVAVVTEITTFPFTPPLRTISMAEGSCTFGTESGRSAPGASTARTVWSVRGSGGPSRALSDSRGAASA